MIARARAAVTVLALAVACTSTPQPAASPSRSSLPGGSTTFAYLKAGDVYVFDGGTSSRVTTAGEYTDLTWSARETLIGVRRGSLMRIELDGSRDPYRIFYGRKHPSAIAAAADGSFAFVAPDDHGLEQVWVGDLSGDGSSPVAPPTQASFVRAGEDSGGDPAFGPLAFSTDGRLLLARFGRRSNASVVRAFDPVTALPVHLPRTLVVGRAAMDPDGTVYGARGTFEEGPYQSDLKLYRGREALLDPSDDPFDVALSPDGKALLFTTVTDYNLGKPDPSLWYMRLGDPGPILIAEGGERGVWPVGEVPGSRPERALPVIEREPAFVAQLPRGWRREPVRSGSEGLKLFSYVKDDLYVHVFAWPNRSIGRSEYKADLTWDLVSREDMTGFDVRKEGPPCTGGDYCERGDGQLAIAGEIVRPVGGIIHDTGFLLKFGSTARETGVDLDVFREILGSFIIE